MWNDPQLALASGNDLGRGTMHPAVAHQELGFGLSMMVKFARRSASFYQALQKVAEYLPNEGSATQEAMSLVTEQRIWMYDVGCAVGAAMGTCYHIESNMLQELERLWRTGMQPGLTAKMQKKNFRATHKNLLSLREDRQAALAKIDECKEFANKMVTWHGTEEKIQHAAVRVLAKFGGSEECEAHLDDLWERQRVLNEARQAEKDASAQLAQITGRRDELQCRSVVYDCLANNEKADLETLQTRAKQLGDTAAAKTQEAATTLNIEYKKLNGWFGSWYTDWVDNRGDCARWRAERFKEIAKEAKEAEGDQGERAKKACSDAASIKGELTKTQKGMEEALKTLSEKNRATADAEKDLLETRSKINAMRSDHGNLDLPQIAKLRDHMQAFPELLGATGTADNAMFETMRGELKRHEMMCDRFAEFLDEEDEAECLKMLVFLKEEIAITMANAKFFAQEMKPLQSEIAHRMKAITQPDQITNVYSNVPTPSRSTTTALGADAAPQPPTFSLAELDQDDLW